MVLTRLCVALASLILHTLLDSWTTAVPDLLRAFQGGEGSVEVDVRYQALLEVLVVLPEELQTRKLSAERQAQLQSALAREWSSLCPLLRKILRREDAAGQVNTHRPVEHRKYSMSVIIEVNDLHSTIITVRL